jgi:hypothetical protein
MLNEFEGRHPPWQTARHSTAPGGDRRGIEATRGACKPATPKDAIWRDRFEYPKRFRFTNSIASSHKMW